MAERPTPRELWLQARRETASSGIEAHRQRYVELLAEYGHVIPNPPCPICGSRARHRHAFVDGADRVIPIDIFGHDRG